MSQAEPRIDPGEDYRYDEQENGPCELCGGLGIIITCVDDMCRGSGECMHGDGETLCPNGCDPY